MAEGRTLGDPETVHYGLVPRTNRGIFSVNELPDLAERIQVALLNVLEERDIQIRGYRVRLPLDLLLVASANPEDYTNRGRIITPLKDRFGAEVRTHYPLELADEIRLLHQEAHVAWTGGRRPSSTRSSPSTWPRSWPGSPGWSASPATSTSGRASAPGSPSRAWRRSRPPPSAGPPSPARPGRWPASSTCPASCPPAAARSSSPTPGPIRTTSASWRCSSTCCARPRRRPSAPAAPGWTSPACRSTSPAGRPSSPASSSRPPALLGQLGTIPKLAELLGRLGVPEGEQSAEQAAAAVEFALEGLYLTRRLAKDTDGTRTVYGA